MRFLNQDTVLIAMLHTTLRHIRSIVKGGHTCNINLIAHVQDTNRSINCSTVEGVHFLATINYKIIQ